MGVLQDIITRLVGADQVPVFTTSEMEEVGRAVDYFNRVDDRQQIKDRIKTLYGQGIKAADPKSKNSVELYTRRGFTEQVDADMIEAVSIGFGAKVVNALASLFTEAGSSYRLKIEGSDDNPEAAEELLMQHRRDGGYNVAMVNADKGSIRVGSCGVLLGFEAGSVQYQHVSPNLVRAVYNTTIEENGIVRFVDQRNIDDAAVIIIRLSQIDVEVWSYLAIFRRCELYPNGRYVQYTAGDTIDVPAPYSSGVIDYQIGGELCNPLSWYAAKHPEEYVPEYPLSVIYGGIAEADRMMPLTTSLYETCKEMSCAISHTLSKSQEAAAGTKVIERDVTAAASVLPKSLTGNVSLLPGQKFAYYPHDSKAAVDAYGVIRKMMVDFAEGYSVPDYMAVSEDQRFDQASGIALDIKTGPLKKFMRFRADDNSKTIQRMFAQEKALITLYAEMGGSGDDRAAVEELKRCSLTWRAGEMRLPENRKEKMERIAKGIEKGIYDTIAAIREEYELPSDDDAIKLYNRMKDRGAEYPPLVQAQKPAIGLRGRGAAASEPGVKAQ